MKARVYVTMKTSVLDPQGQTVRAALQSMGHGMVQDVRQGKYFELDLQSSDRAAAASELDQISREILSNPVIEEYRVELLD
jgi:phosphoribosylformylglycinamidine synthase